MVAQKLQSRSKKSLILRALILTGLLQIIQPIDCFENGKNIFWYGGAEVYYQSWLFVGIFHPTKKNPDPGDKKSPGYSEGIKSRKNPEFCINPGDFAKIPGIKISKLRKIPNPGDKNLLPTVAAWFS